MAAATTLTKWDAVLKQYYTNKKVEDLVYDSHPLFELIPKDESFNGHRLRINVLYGVIPWQQPPL